MDKIAGKVKDEISKTHSFAELCRKIGYKPGPWILRKLKKIIRENEIDISHFDRLFIQKSRKRHFLISRICPVCNEDFETFSGGKNSHVYCSKQCCNSLHLGNRSSPESVQKLKKSLARKYEHLRVQQKCICGKIFLTKKKSIYCCQSCATKACWLKPEYREKILLKIKENVITGRHQGWKSRGILSYAEKYFQLVLNNEDLKDKYITNFPVLKSSIGFNQAACYFLDFYFPEIKLDLEIDGKQHNYPERKASDIVRDEALEKHGYTVYRIKWKNPAFDPGYIKEEIKKFFEFYNTLTHK